MSKESQKIINAYMIGQNDRILKRPYKNPFSKNREKDKFKAYKHGYNLI